MLTALPLIALALLIAAGHRAGHRWRESAAAGSLLWGGLVVTVTESVSLFANLATDVLAAVWAAVCIPLIASLWRTRTRSAQSPRWSTCPIVKSMWAGVCAVAAITLLTALVAPPNTLDSLSYHMARVAHWNQQGHVGHYSTQSVQQLFQPAMAEYVILNLQVLSGGDRFANIVQWLALLGAVSGASLIARELGADRLGQALAALLAATVPMAVLQSSSTQNDLVVGHWVMCLVYYSLRHVNEPPASGAASYRDYAFGGLAAGLAVATKGTAYLYVPAVLALFLPFAMRARCRRSVVPALCALALAAGLNAANFTRNAATFGSSNLGGLLGTIEMPRVLGPILGSFVNLRLDPGVVPSNTVRNLALLIATPSESMNRGIEAGVVGFHELFGLDASDPASTFGRTEFGLSADQNNEDFSGAWLHALLFITCLLLVARRSRGLARPRTVQLYGLGIVIGFVLFSTAFRWQPWQCRLLLPLTLLSCAFTAVTLCGVRSEIRRSMVTAVGVSTLCLALFPALQNSTRGIVAGSESIFVRSRDEQYFGSARGLREDYLAAIALLDRSSATTVGLITHGAGAEYPLWVAGEGGRVVVPLQVTNASATLGTIATETFPEFIVVLHVKRPASLAIAGHTYVRIYESDQVDVHHRVGAVAGNDRPNRDRGLGARNADTAMTTVPTAAPS